MLQFYLQTVARLNSEITQADKTHLLSHPKNFCDEYLFRNYMFSFFLPKSVLHLSGDPLDVLVLVLGGKKNVLNLFVLPCQPLNISFCP